MATSDCDCVCRRQVVYSLYIAFTIFAVLNASASDIVVPENGMFVSITCDGHK